MDGSLRDEERDMWGEEPIDEYEEDNDPICSQCSRPTAGEGCGQCGVDLCPMCFECGGGFCSKHPDSEYQPEEDNDPNLPYYQALNEKISILREALYRISHYTGDQWIVDISLDALKETE